MGIQKSRLNVGHKKAPTGFLARAFSCDGGSWAARTPDQLVKSQLLYQLS